MHGSADTHVIDEVLHGDIAVAVGSPAKIEDQQSRLADNAYEITMK